MPFPSRRILHVEDHADTRELVTFLLGGHGFNVVGVERPKTALELARTERFDLFIIDNGLPELSGVALCIKLRGFGLKAPILFCSGAASDADREAALSSGAQGYLVKPLDHNELVAEVLRLTDK